MIAGLGQIGEDHPLFRMLMEGMAPENPMKGLKYLPVEVHNKLKDVTASFCSVVATTCGMEIKDTGRFKESIGEMPDEEKTLLVEAWLDYMLNAAEKCRNLLINRLKEIRKDQ